MTKMHGRSFQQNHPLLSLLLSFISGASLVFAFAPFSFWALPFIALPFWFWQIHKCNTKQSFQHGFSFGFGLFSTGISWVHVSIEQFGGMPLIASLFLMLLLCVYLALYPALAVWLSAKLTKQKKVNLYYLPFIWLFTEYLRSVMLTGFPWLSLGYSQIDSPLAQIAPMIGEVGITFVLLFTAICTFLLVVKENVKRNISLLVLMSVFVIVSQFTTFVEVTEKSFTTALVQGNIKQELRWDEQAEQDIINSYITSSESLYANNDVVIWPEAAIPRLEPLAQDYLITLNKQALAHQSSLLTGIINYDPNSRRFFNRIIVLGQKQAHGDISSYYYGSSNHYDKHHLLPIGEFVPFADLLRPIAPFFNLPMSSFSRGDYAQTNLQANGLHFAPLICFEIAFPQQLAANMQKNTNAILTISNDAWFGDSHGPDQHLEIARMRSLEFGRPTLRSTNNGLTAVIDHKGKVIADIEQFSKAVLQTEVLIVNGQTPFNVWGRFLDKLLIALFIVYLVASKLYRNNVSQH